MTFHDMPKTWRGINLSIIEYKQVADLTLQYSIQFTYGNFISKETFLVPKTDKNRFSMNGYNYVVWYRLCKPICSIEYIYNKHTVFINNILTRPDRPMNYDLIFTLDKDELICEYNKTKYNIDNSYLHDVLYSYWLTNSDRKSLNEFIESDSTENYITQEDISRINIILRENQDYTINWKDLELMRVIDLESLIISTIMLSLPNVLKKFFSTGEIVSGLLTKSIRTMLVTDAPEIRLDLNETEIASYAQNSKVILPFDNYCNVNELIPDKQWYKYLDMLDAPQSIKVGSVASLSNKTIIKDNKIIINHNEILEEIYTTINSD